MALLKRDHGIEVKSASSTIEEVVGRQFVDRLARQRGVTLPSGDVFAEGAAAKAAPKKPALVKKGAAQEPAKPAAPTLGPPRLVKAAKAIHQAERAAAASHDAGDADAVAEYEPTDVHEPHAEAEVDHAPVEEVPVTHVTHATEPEVEVELPVAEFPAVAPTADTRKASRPRRASQAPHAPTIPLPTGVVHQPSGRIVPPSLRLRIEDPNAPVTPRPPATRPAPARSRARAKRPRRLALARLGSWDRRQGPARRRWRHRGLESCPRGPRRRAVHVRRIRRHRRLAARVRCPVSRFARSSPAWAHDPACPAVPACRRPEAHGPDSLAAGVRRHPGPAAAAGTPRAPSSLAARWRRRRRRPSPRTSPSPRA